MLSSIPRSHNHPNPGRFSGLIYENVDPKAFKAAEEMGAQIRWDFTKNCEQFVLTDEDLPHQSVFNAINNKLETVFRPAHPDQIRSFAHAVTERLLDGSLNSEEKLRTFQDQIANILSVAEELQKKATEAAQQAYEPLAKMLGI